MLVFLCLTINLDFHSCLITLFFLELFAYSLLYLSNWHHLIILLIVLELFMLKIYFLRVRFSIRGSASYFTFFFITLSVAEARVGLSLLTILVRANGDDFIFTDSF